MAFPRSEATPPPSAERIALWKLKRQKLSRIPPETKEIISEFRKCVQVTLEQARHFRWFRDHYCLEIDIFPSVLICIHSVSLQSTLQPIQSKAGTGQSVRLSTAGIFYLNPNPTNGERLHAKEYRYVRGKKFQQLHALLMSQLSPIFVQFHHPSRRTYFSLLDYHDTDLMGNFSGVPRHKKIGFSVKIMHRSIWKKLQQLRGPIPSKQTTN